MGKIRTWRKEIKKFRRKRIRQKIAAERAKKLKEEEECLLKDPAYQVWLKEQEILEQHKTEEEERIHDEEEEKWLRQDLFAQKRFREELKKRKEIEKVREEERLRIQQEFEKQQELVRQRVEERRRVAEEKQRKHEQLLQKIQDYIDSDCPMPEELEEPADTNPGKEICPFFTKTASCRFGDKCSRNHSRPGISKILLLPHFFNHIRLDQNKITEYGSDLALEFSDAELYRDFVAFFEDVVPELEKYGRLENFRACKNSEPHLRGNVYVEYLEQRDALRAYLKLQGRYYASKRINVEFARISSWKSAICAIQHVQRFQEKPETPPITQRSLKPSSYGTSFPGLSLSRKCPKGKNCNFLHIFRNPQNKYNASLYSDSSCRSERIDPKKEKNTGESPSFEEGSSQRRNWRWSETPERCTTNERNLSQGRYSREKISSHRKRRSRSRSRSDKKHEDRLRRRSRHKSHRSSNNRSRSISTDRNSSRCSSKSYSSRRKDQLLLKSTDSDSRRNSKASKQRSTRKSPVNIRRKKCSKDMSRGRSRSISTETSSSSEDCRKPKRKRNRKKKKRTRKTE